MSKKLGFVSLGCSKNQLDTEVMLHELVSEGYEIVSEDIDADVVIVNTCAFIESAKQEAIDNILDVAWLKKHRKLKGIVVTGCLAERYRDEIFKEIPEVDAVLGVGSIHEICKAVKKVLEGEKFSSYLDKNEVKLGGDRVLTTPEYYAYLKVAEGCDNKCTYCAIPSIRGKFRSRPIEDLVAEAKDLEALGVKELNIIAQDTSRYGLDLYGEYSLAKLLRAISDNTKIPWIRILYCYPDKISDELIAEMRDNDRIVKYIDLPIQHISDPVLNRMNRHGGSEVIKNAIARIRKEIPEAIIRTTVIVGFPGETEEDFETLCEFIKETKFDRLGAFTYSREEDTPAYDMEDQIDEQIKQDRADAVMALQTDIAAVLNSKSLGKEMLVLCEGYDPVSEVYFGRSKNDAPDIDGKVYFTSSKKRKEGAFLRVKIKDVVDYDLYGECIGEVKHL
ncbi:MAG: 30S ribosomal protein S12 methylthiotransferase RimO [Ruminococcaceae bacterium]|nr:30S ribosomal protein S12 methylthiotransferase RimO [Oscillospiraceae bacterium]